MYLLKLALRPWRLAPLSQVFSAVAVGFLLLLSAFLVWMHRGLDPLLARMKAEQVITAYLDPSVENSKDAQGRIVDSIRTAVGAQAVRDIQLVEADQFLGQLKTHYPELARELESLGPEASSIIPRYVSISGMLEDATLDRVKSVTGVESAETSKDRYRHMVSAFTALKWVLNFLVAGIGLALLTGLIHLARTNAYLHRDALSLLRLWGAGEWTLRSPGMISAMIPGLMGGAIAAAGWAGFGNAMVKSVRSLSPMLQELPAVYGQLWLVLLAAGVALGAVAGLLTGFAGATVSRERA